MYGYRPGTLASEMHVLFVGPFPWPSHQGSQVYLAGQARALARRGHEVSVAVYGAGVGGELPGVRLVRARHVPLTRFTTGGMHWSRPLADLSLARTVRQFCKRHEVDVLHTHNVEGPLVARLAATNVPIVYDLHTRMEAELATHLRPPLDRFGPTVGRRLDRWATDSADVGCAISNEAHTFLRNAGLPTVTVGPGIDTDELVARPDARERFDLPKRFVVYTGNLDRYQDVPLLLDAMRTVDVPLVVVTGSPDPLPDDVHVIRSRAFQDALDVLSAATIAVIPRRQCTGFPIKLLNQLGMGCPTVMVDPKATPLPGVVICPPGDLAPTLNRLLDTPSKLRRLGTRARRAVRTRWTWGERARQLEALYALALTETARSP